MSIYFHYLQEDQSSKILQEGAGSAYTLLLELGSLQVEVDTLVLTVTPKDVSIRHYWTKESTHSPNWVKE